MLFFFIPDRLKTQAMCEKAIEKNPQQLKSVPDCFRTQEMCSKAVEEDP